jgi:hypothetical protein
MSIKKPQCGSWGRLKEKQIVCHNIYSFVRQNLTQYIQWQSKVKIQSTCTDKVIDIVIYELGQY